MTSFPNLFIYAMGTKAQCRRQKGYCDLKESYKFELYVMQNYVFAELREKNGSIIIPFYISGRSIQISFYSFLFGQPDGKGHILTLDIYAVSNV